MKRIESYTGLVPKLKGSGTLEYALWINDSGKLFIQILKNIIKDSDKPGTHTKFFIRVSDYIDDRYSSKKYTSIKGINQKSKQNEEVTNNNNNSFIKAILRHLFPKTPRPM
ncbi:MAG: hypothetical protein D4R63_11950 [Methylococcaceae bacterium]|nr:MAG: hypothetical protein D4R63_11950 [Methylococcaceae bacterium]